MILLHQFEKGLVIVYSVDRQVHDQTQDVYPGIRTVPSGPFVEQRRAAIFWNRSSLGLPAPLGSVSTGLKLL